MNPVESLNQEYNTIISYLIEKGQPSFSNDINKHFKKNLVLSAASYFEHELTSILTECVVKKTNNSDELVSFFRKKAISMNYHTLFYWGEKDNPDQPGKNANTFLSLFGASFKTQCEKEIKDSSGLDMAVKAFLEIGHLRNILVHSNFASYELDNKTTEEIYSLFKKGIVFIDYIGNKLLSTSSDQSRRPARSYLTYRLSRNK